MFLDYEHRGKHPQFIDGVEYERDRIIKILESENLEWRPLKDNPHNLIALIKGE